MRILCGKNINEILDGLSWAVLGVHEMGKVDGGTEKVDGGTVGKAEGGQVERKGRANRTRRRR